MKKLLLIFSLLFAPCASLLAATNGAGTGSPDDYTARVVLASSTPYYLIGAGTTNATVLKASAGQLTSICIQNVAATVRYVKFYNKATAPTVGTDVPVYVIGLPATSTVVLSFPQGVSFATGISFGTVTAAADASTAAITAGDLIIALTYN